MMTKEKHNKFQLWYAISLAFQLGFLIVVPLSGFMLLGFWGDNLLHSSPWFLLAGTLIGLGLTIYETYYFLLPLIKKHDQH